LRTVIFRGFEGVNKVALDRGFKQIFGIGLKQAKDFSDELMESKVLTFTNVSEEHVVQLLALGDKANVSVEVQ
jgi:hypothetical protein